MTKVKGITIELETNTDKMQLKLRAIAKHTEALANELDAIDNAWQCDYCGHHEYVKHHVSGNDQLCKCAKCNEKCVIKK